MFDFIVKQILRDKMVLLNTTNLFYGTECFVKGKDGWYYISVKTEQCYKADFTVEFEGLSEATFYKACAHCWWLIFTFFSKY